MPILTQERIHCMSMELQIIRAADFIRLGPKGKIDLEISRRYLRNLAQACRRRGISRALIDIRAVEVPPTPRLRPMDYSSLISAFGELGFSRSDRVAVLYSKDPHHGARMFAFIGKARGWQVRAFDDFETAIAWLSEKGEIAVDPWKKDRRVRIETRNEPRGRRIPPARRVKPAREVSTGK
ncbi:MAG TPA: STAS/SEC14 domain-containing protein [Verrucomicrobiae bacterium]|nr:STAS/SEC14 domain-containing protein [Verrucomicrobiae bacterium]